MCILQSTKRCTKSHFYCDGKRNSLSINTWVMYEKFICFIRYKRNYEKLAGTQLPNEALH